MAKKKKVLIIISLVLLVLVLCLVLTSESVKKTGSLAQQVTQQVKKQEVVMSDESYKAQVKEIFGVYEKMTTDNNFSVERTTELKDKLLGIKGLPAQFQKLHLNFILALDKLESYFTRKDLKAKTASQQMTDQLKTDYSWLNN